MEFSTPPRDRVPHARKLVSDIESARDAISATVDSQAPGQTVHNVCLECFSEPNHPLRIESLEDRRSGIELLTVRTEETETNEMQTFATIFIPEAKVEAFIRKIERYETENDLRRTDGGPKNKDLVESISGFRVPFVKSFFTDRDELFPEQDESIWWEVWLRAAPNQEGEGDFPVFRDAAAGTDIRLIHQVVSFPERVVFLARATPRQWAESMSLLLLVAELRRAKEVPSDFLELSPSDQGDLVLDLASRIYPPHESSPAVCILDTGVNWGHPLLEGSLDPQDAQAIRPDWSSADEHGHGTRMAGLAICGDNLTGYLLGNQVLELQHRLESVKVFRIGSPHDPDNYGYVTTEAVALAEVQSPDRNRVACLAISAGDTGGGLPSLWSAALDQHSAGALDDKRRLYVVAVGNTDGVDYPSRNYRAGVDDPAQSWNALSIGAFTNKVDISSPEFRDYLPLAPLGGLCPTSRTSRAWAREWPLKPDVVMEGGNYVLSPEGEVDACQDLELLTTTVHPSGRLLDSMSDSSAATAQASRLAARLMASYPELWPETVRGLVIHSAEWTSQMEEEFPSHTKALLQERIRCYGFGVPDLERALWTLDNEVSLVYQGYLQPFQLSEGSAKTHEYHIHDLPWPVDVLRSLGETTASIRVTLSYFVEPSPGRRGWSKKFRYASHGLRFALRGPTEPDEDFERRVSKASWVEGEEPPSTSEPTQQQWTLGSKLRARGSVHSDAWESATAADLADCGCIAVYPVTGWWRERKHLGRLENETRYALIVTIKTPDSTVDLYTPIAQQVGITTEIPI